MRTVIGFVFDAIMILGSGDIQPVGSSTLVEASEHRESTGSEQLELANSHAV